MSLRQVVLSTYLAMCQCLQLDRSRSVSVSPARRDKDLVDWHLCNHDVAVPNFGGKGPDGGPEEMRLPEITKANGQTLDLVVSVHDEAKAGWETNPEKNRVENCFGYTNVAAGSKVRLNFRFTKPGESSAWDPGSYVPYFKFTIMDLGSARDDGLADGSGDESETTEDIRWTDTGIIYATYWADYGYWDHRPISGSPMTDNEIQDFMDMDNGYSRRNGRTWDNYWRAVFFNYNCLELVTVPDPNYEQVVFHTDYDHLYLNDPHDFHYHKDEKPVAFMSKIHGNELDNPTTNATELSPYQQTRSFTVGYLGKTEWDISFYTKFDGGKKKGGRNFIWAGASDIPDAQACEEWTDATFAWGLCDSELTINNLGGYGPDHEKDTPEEIRYAKVGHFHGKDLDLRVVADEEYAAYNISRNTVVDTATRKYASLHGCYGAINVKSDSKVTLEFSFVDHETGDVLALGEDDGFGFTVYDIDRDQQTDAEEIVQFITPYAHGDEHGAIHGEHVGHEDGREFRALSYGNGTDNVYDGPEAETDEQKAKSVRVMYQGSARWKVQFQVHGGTEGRNFLFSGCSHTLEDVPQPHSGLDDFGH